MKVSILTEGGRDIGFGHLTRCIALYQAFEERGIIPEFIVNAGTFPESLPEGIKCQVFNWLKEERLFKLIHDADICIIDSYLAGSDLYQKISGAVKVPAYIDDNKRLDYPRGVVINGSVYAEELNYPRREGVTYLLGSQYFPLRKEFMGAGKKEISNNLENIMVTLGGTDKANMTPAILKFLKDSYRKLTKNVIIGSCFQNVEKIKGLKDENTNLNYSPDAERIKAIMEESDLAVSAGGQTLYELARAGVPAIGICVAENQLGNVMGWEKIGFLEYIGWYNDKNFTGKLENAIRRLEDTDIRKSKSEAGRKVMDGKGSLRIIKVLLLDYFKNNFSLRRAAPGDTLNVFNLSNDDAVRDGSFDSKKIEWDRHTKWFGEKLNDKNCVFFVLNTLGEFAGQLRFDINPDKGEAIISISVVKTMRELGLSSFILNKAIDALLKIRKDVKLIKAYIKEKNLSSIKSFESTHFKFLEDALVKGHRAKVYIRETGRNAV